MEGDTEAEVGIVIFGAEDCAAMILSIWSLWSLLRTEAVFATAAGISTLVPDGAVGVAPSMILSMLSCGLVSSDCLRYAGFVVVSAGGGSMTSMTEPICG